MTIPARLKTALTGAALSMGIGCVGVFAPAALADKPGAAASTQTVSGDVSELAGWVIATKDNRGYPFAIIDKQAAEILIFDADGKLKGRTPALLGSAVGDHSAPGVGDRELKDIPAEDRTTPAGRFIAGYGPATGGQRVLWVDYETAISIHPVATGNRAEKREERLASKTAEDNRITHGCINVAKAFYDKTVQPTFTKGGVFYVLPDTVEVHEAFPGYARPNLAFSLVEAYRIATHNPAKGGGR
ncbi:MAG: hypothetical protein R3C46_03815 [Hyphomonadaceae bacterium]